MHILISTAKKNLFVILKLTLRWGCGKYHFYQAKGKHRQQPTLRWLLHKAITQLEFNNQCTSIVQRANTDKHIKWLYLHFNFLLFAHKLTLLCRINLYQVRSQHTYAQQISYTELSFIEYQLNGLYYFYFSFLCIHFIVI